MIRQYLRSGGTGSSSVSTFFQSNVFDSQDADSITYTSTIKGAPSAVITITVTSITHSNAGYYFQVDGIRYVQGNTFTRTLNGSGLISFVQYANVGTSIPDNAIDVILTITATTNGTVTSPSTTNISKTT